MIPEGQVPYGLWQVQCTSLWRLVLIQLRRFFLRGCSSGLRLSHYVRIELYTMNLLKEIQQIRPQTWGCNEAVNWLQVSAFQGIRVSEASFFKHKFCGYLLIKLYMLDMLDDRSGGQNAPLGGLLGGGVMTAQTYISNEAKSHSRRCW